MIFPFFYLPHYLWPSWSPPFPASHAHSTCFVCTRSLFSSLSFPSNHSTPLQRPCTPLQRLTRCAFENLRRFHLRRRNHHTQGNTHCRRGVWLRGLNSGFHLVLPDELCSAAVNRVAVALESEKKQLLVDSPVRNVLFWKENRRTGERVF